MRYRTEIVIPPDRYVCVQLPDYLPEGAAVVTIVVAGPDPAPLAEAEDDREDIEWWDDLDADPGGRR